MRAKHFCNYVFIVYINDLWLFLMVPWFSLQCVVVVFPYFFTVPHLLFKVPWVGLQYVIVAFLGHTQLLFDIIYFGNVL